MTVDHSHKISFLTRQEVYTCTNEEVLSALFIGINVRDIDSSSQPGKT